MGGGGTTAPDLFQSIAPDFKARGPVTGGQYGDLSRDGSRKASVARAEPQIFIGDDARPGQQAAAAEPADKRVRVADNDDVVPVGDGAYQLNFDEADVGAVAKAVLGDILHANYMIDKRVAGQVTLTSSQPVPRARLLPLLESALASVGASVVKDRDLYRVVLSADPGGIGAVDTRGTGEGFGTSVIAAKFMPAQELGHLLEGFGTRNGSVRADQGSNYVVVQGTASERRAAADAAAAVDVDWLKSKSVAILPTANSAPETVIAEINRIMENGDGGAAQGIVQLEPISRLNAVLAVSRRPEGIAFARKWVARLDRLDPNAAGLKAYRLQYAQAKTVAATLNDMFGNGSGEGGAPEKDLLEPGGGASSQTSAPASSGAGLTQASLSSGAGASGGGTGSGLGAAGGDNGQDGAASNGGGTSSSSPYGMLKAAFTADAARKGAAAEGGAGPRAGGSRVRITADTSSNTLLINASPTEYRLVERAIRQLDRAPIQVAIEATIAEVTLTQDLQYGIQFFLQNQKGTVGLSGASGFPLQTFSSSGLNILAGAAANPKVLLDALQSFTTVRILSSPSLVVLDRQNATLQVGDQVPILTRTAQSVDTSSTAPVVNNVDYRDTGVILNVLPRVNATGLVTLDVEQQISAVTSTDAATLTPTISQRRVRSTVSVANGQTVMLAGLIGEKQSRTQSGLPYLSSIRFLGDLLTSHDNLLNRTEIIIFIRPQIITNPADAQDVTQEFHNRLMSMRLGAPPPAIRKY